MAEAFSAEAAARYLGRDMREAIAAVTRDLAAAGIEEPVRDARLLVLGASGATAAELLGSPERRIDEAAAVKLAGMVARRLMREPVSRILGERGFYGRSFAVTPATLDPRPCTETVIEAALAVADREGWRDKPVRILDVGTGSGALLVTLLAELPLATGVGTDISEEALDTARANAVRAGVEARARFLNRSMLDGVPAPFDMLVSNPPYIPSADIAGLDPEVRLYDPRAALNGGADGLDFYREIARGAAAVMAPGGWVLLEVGAGQAEAVATLLRDTAADQGQAAEPNVEMWPDLGCHIRCVAAKTQN